MRYGPKNHFCTRFRPFRVDWYHCRHADIWTVGNVGNRNHSRFCSKNWFVYVLYSSAAIGTNLDTSGCRQNFADVRKINYVRYRPKNHFCTRFRPFRVDWYHCRHGDIWTVDNVGNRNHSRFGSKSWFSYRTSLYLTQRLALMPTSRPHWKSLVTLLLDMDHISTLIRYL